MVKILNLTDQKVYEIDATKQGENTIICPTCSKDRKKK